MRETFGKTMKQNYQKIQKLQNMMTSLELLQNNPKTTTVIKQWFLGKLLDSLNDDKLPENFKEFVRAQDLEDDKLATIIDANPRMLFDVFDEHKVYVQINVNTPYFSYSINEGDVISGSWETRIEAEKAAIEQAFEILNNKL
jgi:hypothetical protein